MTNQYPTLKQSDKTVYRLIELEQRRQAESLMMIPSENYASRAVEEALASPFGNKYAEGYPGRRYYQGNIHADEIENLCIERAKKLYDVPYVNVQPHSGSPANFAVEMALLAPGDSFMGLALASGGHLTHGARLTAGARFFKSVQYSVTQEGFIDYDAVARLALEAKPRLIIAGTTAYPRVLDWRKFASIAKESGAYLLADISHLAGLIAGGAYPSPVPYVDIVTTTTHKTLRGPRGAMIMVTARGLKRDADLPKKINSAIIPGIQGGPHLNSIAGIAVALKEAGSASFGRYATRVVTNAKTLAEALTERGFKLVTGGTDSHLLVADVSGYGILGNTMAEGCEMGGIILNRNAVPHDPNPPFYPSGIRFGTPGVTSRGMGVREMRLIASWLVVIAHDLQDTAAKLGMSLQDQKRPENRTAILKKSRFVRVISTKTKDLCRKFPIPKQYR